MKKKCTPLAVLLLLVLWQPLHAQLPELNLELFSSGYSNPVDIANCGDSRLFIVEKVGKIWICDDQGNKSAQPFMNIMNKVLSTGGEQGLLGLAFHPDYANNGYFYVNYTNKNGHTQISRYTVSATNPNKADPASQLKMLTIKQPFANHNGGCLKFGPDGYLYIGMGDGGSAGDPNNNGQKTTALLGKILRIDVDGGTPYAIPPSNPFVGMPGYRPEIWAMGVRNPWRISFDQSTGDLWIADVGQGSYEEVNYQQAVSNGGENYGWRCYEGNHPFNTNGCGLISEYDFPVAEYTHSGGDCSVTGGFVYRGAEYANMNGKYFCVDYCTGKFRAIYFDGAVWQNNLVLDSSPFEFVSFGEDLNAELYVAKISAGTILHVTDTSSGAPFAGFKVLRNNHQGISQLKLSASKGKNLSYQWRINDEDIKGATLPEFIPLVSGSYEVRVTNVAGFSSTSTSQWVEVTNEQVSLITENATNRLLSDPSLQNQVSLYPNPNTGQFTVEWISQKEEDCKAEIFNMLGERVIRENKLSAPGLNKWSFSSDRLLKGTYLLEIHSSVGLIQKKFVVE